MSRYIDAEKLTDFKFSYITNDRYSGGSLKSEEEIYAYKVGYNTAIEDARFAPTVDVVEVVRCKDCRWGKEACGNIECFADTNVPPEYHGYEWFCPNGERKK